MRLHTIAAVLGAAQVVALSSFAAVAATKTFVGPSGWDHTVGMTSSAQSPRSQETWKKSDGQQINYLSDATTSYDDIVGMVKKNFADNGFKPAMDVDRKCDGRRAHEIDIVFGTADVHQMIVDDAPGVTKITYTRNQGTAFAPDVTSALTAYCGPAG